VRRNGPTASSVVLLGNIVGMQGRHLEAAALFEQALALDPTSSEARNGLRVARRMAEEAG
jgi:Flp pilus assembly protein TadD